MSEPFPDPRALLGRYGLSAKKSWGQNFLVSERVYRSIVDATVMAVGDWVVELGAGLGTLTMRLADRAYEGKVFAVERDRDLVAVLHEELGHLEGIEIVADNALTYDIGMVARWRGEPVIVCGNLPYNIASQILFRIVESRRSISHAVVMIQREMADRLLAEPGTKAYGALGVLVRAYLDVHQVLRVRHDAFSPPPKVESTVVKLVPLAEGEPRAPFADEGMFRDLVHVAFQQRRKTLRNAMRARFDTAIVDAALAAAAIDGKRRGETLSIDEFAALSDALGTALSDADSQ